MLLYIKNVYTHTHTYICIFQRWRDHLGEYIYLRWRDQQTKGTCSHCRFTLKMLLTAGTAQVCPYELQGPNLPECLLRCALAGCSNGNQTWNSNPGTPVRDACIPTRHRPKAHPNIQHFKNSTKSNKRSPSQNRNKRFQFHGCDISHERRHLIITHKQRKCSLAGRYFYTIMLSWLQTFLVTSLLPLKLITRVSCALRIDQCLCTFGSLNNSKRNFCVHPIQT